MISLICITNGRKNYLRQTIESFNPIIHDPLVKERIIIDDSNDADFKNWLDATYAEDFKIQHNECQLGFAGSIQRAWNSIDLTSDYVFHLEDDFNLLVPVKLSDLIAILQTRTFLAQIVLLRNPINNQEVIAGGLMKLCPDEYRQESMRIQYQNGKKHESYPVFWCEHDLYFSTNPNLYPVKIIRSGWPLCEQSGKVFGEFLKTKGFKFAIYGQKADSHRIYHLGDMRTEKSFGY